mmetsp:Transcript_2058/g.6071  ORF Transcript_2058/g.6071 Transcript_2058/m.6071 type:complete len:374 (+) Transcript_2058:135-1256(+)
MTGGSCCKLRPVLACISLLTCGCEALLRLPATQAQVAEVNGSSSLRPKFKQGLDVDWFKRRAVDNIAIISVANVAFVKAVKSWIWHIDQLGLKHFSARHNVSIVCVDTGLRDAMKEMKQPCHLFERADQDAGAFEGVALIRHYVASVLNKKGLDVLYTDVDALWYQNPIPIIRSAAPRGSEAGVVAGPASDHSPEVCTGVIFYHGPIPRTFWDSMEDFVYRGGNDQIKFNKMLKYNGIHWDAPMLNLYQTENHTARDLDRSNAPVLKWPVIDISRVGYWNVPQIGVNVALLPEPAFPRQCKHVKPREVVILHCAGMTGVASSKELNPKIKGLSGKEVLDQLYHISELQNLTNNSYVVELESVIGGGNSTVKLA